MPYQYIPFFCLLSTVHYGLFSIRLSVYFLQFAYQGHPGIGDGALVLMSASSFTFASNTSRVTPHSAMVSGMLTRLLATLFILIKLTADTLAVVDEHIGRIFDALREEEYLTTWRL